MSILSKIRWRSAVIFLLRACELWMPQLPPFSLLPSLLPSFQCVLPSPACAALCHMSFPRDTREEASLSRARVGSLLSLKVVPSSVNLYLLKVQFMLGWVLPRKWRESKQQLVILLVLVILYLLVGILTSQ